MAVVRPIQVVTAMRRLGFIDKPGVGDHIKLFKKVTKHPCGELTLQTGLDGQHCGKGDIARIKRETGLSSDLWDRAMKKELPIEEYDKVLRATPKEDLVLPFWRQTVLDAKKAVSKPVAKRTKKAATKKK